MPKLQGSLGELLRRHLKQLAHCLTLKVSVYSCSEDVEKEGADDGYQPSHLLIIFWQLYSKIEIK